MNSWINCLQLFSLGFFPLWFVLFCFLFIFEIHLHFHLNLKTFSAGAGQAAESEAAGGLHCSKQEASGQSAETDGGYQCPPVTRSCMLTLSLGI